MPHTDPADPPRRRANQDVGHGTWDTDRPPGPAAVGRESGRLLVRVGRRSGAAEVVHATVLPATKSGAMVDTDDGNGYNPLARCGRGHATVNKNQGEYARDDDGDGVREVHRNTLEGIWTGLRNYLRIFRGVSKHYLAQYVAVFLWSYNIKAVTDGFLRVLMGTRAVTALRT